MPTLSLTLSPTLTHPVRRCDSIAVRPAPEAETKSAARGAGAVTSHMEVAHIPQRGLGTGYSLHPSHMAQPVAEHALAVAASVLSRNVAVAASVLSRNVAVAASFLFRNVAVAAVAAVARAARTRLDWTGLDWTGLD